MEAYCLRRSESCLSLPASREEVVPLYLSPPERQAYDGVLDDARRQIDDMVSSGKHAGVRCSKLFTALLRMRMMCNTGTYASIQGSQDMLTSPSPLKPENLLSQCEKCSAADGDTLMLLSTCEVCPDCMRPLRQRSPSPLSSLASRLENVAVSAKGRECSTKLEAVVGILVSGSNSGDKAYVHSFISYEVSLNSILTPDSALCSPIGRLRCTFWPVYYELPVSHIFKWTETLPS